MAIDEIAYKGIFASKISKKTVAVYGIANYDLIFDIRKHDLETLKINPVFDDIKTRALSGIYKEYNREDTDIKDAIEKLNKLYPSKKILGGNAANISLGLSKLNNRVILNIKNASLEMTKTLSDENITVKSKTPNASEHLIIQVPEEGDRFILSPDYGNEEPELIANKEPCDIAVYSGAHLDAKTPEVQNELLERLKSICENSKLYIELGSGSRMSRDNCIKASGFADIVGMNEQEIKELTGTTDIFIAAERYKKDNMKPGSILIVHTHRGSLAHSETLPDGIEKALALGHLQGTSRYMTGSYLTLDQMKAHFTKIQLYPELKIASNLVWVPSIRHPNPGMAVGSGDGYVAGFITGYLNFCNH